MNKELNNRLRQALDGHGHVFPRPDGMRMRCGGPGLCTRCSLDQAMKQADEEAELRDLRAEVARLLKLNAKLNKKLGMK